MSERRRRRRRQSQVGESEAPRAELPAAEASEAAGGTIRANRRRQLMFDLSCGGAGPSAPRPAPATTAVIGAHTPSASPICSTARLLPIGAYLDSDDVFLPAAISSSRTAAISRPNLPPCGPTFAQGYDGSFSCLPSKIPTRDRAAVPVTSTLQLTRSNGVLLSRGHFRAEAEASVDSWQPPPSGDAVAASWLVPRRVAEGCLGRALAPAHSR